MWSFSHKGIEIGIIVVGKPTSHHLGEGQSGTGDPHNFSSDANNAPVAGLGWSSSRVCTMAFISSARSCAVICFFIRQSLKNLAVPTSKGVEIVESVSTAPATYSSLIPIGNRSHWSYVKATDWAWAAVVRDSRPRLTRRTRFSRGGLLDVVPCPLLAQSGHPLLHCTCPLSGVKRT